MRSHHAHHVVPIATTAGVVPAPANPREASRLALARRERFRVLPGALHSSNFRVNQTSDGPSEPSVSVPAMSALCSAQSGPRAIGVADRSRSAAPFLIPFSRWWNQIG
jgi:hypothetical protein